MFWKNVPSKTAEVEYHKILGKAPTTKTLSAKFLSKKTAKTNSCKYFFPFSRLYTLYKTIYIYIYLYIFFWSMAQGTKRFCMAS